MRISWSKTKKSNKRGSISIFLLIILSGIIGLTLVYIQGARQVGALGYMDGVFHLSGRSVLSEYSNELKQDYGIFAMRGTAEDIEKKLGRYIQEMIEEKEQLTLADLRANVSEDALINVDAFEEEVLDYTKYALARELLFSKEEASSSLPALPGEAPSRTLRNKKVIRALPGQQLGDNGNLIETIKSSLKNMDQVFVAGGKNYLLNQYILAKFNHVQGPKLDRETFFQCEVEYILERKLSDEENKKAFKGDLRLLRNVPNLVFIYGDPVKRAELIAAAELITPGPAGIVTQLVLAEAWALAESENDVKLLENGKKVPLYKTPLTWAVDLQSIVNGTDAGYIDTNSPTGFTYENYLEIFLFF
ncbi:MAG: DUF5702 domain-containing protein, partial [Anaerovoracaceae bacterium]